LFDGSRSSPRRIGRVDLTVADLDRSLAFYQGVLGLIATPQDDGGVLLAGPDGAILLALSEGATAPAAPGPDAGGAAK